MSKKADWGLLALIVIIGTLATLYAKQTVTLEWRDHGLLIFIFMALFAFILLETGMHHGLEIAKKHSGLSKSVSSDEEKMYGWLSNELHEFVEQQSIRRDVLNTALLNLLKNYDENAICTFTWRESRPLGKEAVTGVFSFLNELFINLRMANPEVTEEMEQKFVCMLLSSNMFNQFHQHEH